jgi:hypothetical protein
MIKKITRTTMSAKGNIVDKQVTIYYFFFVPFYEIVKEFVRD